MRRIGDLWLDGRQYCWYGEQRHESRVPCLIRGDLNGDLSRLAGEVGYGAGPEVAARGTCICDPGCSASLGCSTLVAFPFGATSRAVIGHLARHLRSQLALFLGR